MIPNDNSTQVLIKFTQALNIPLTKQTICDELDKHPNYDSLFAFSDVLDRWSVPNAAYKLSFEQLTDVPTPFIAYLSRNEFGLVTGFDEHHVTLSNERWDNKRFPLNDFKRTYSGAVLLAERAEGSGEPDHERKRSAERITDLRKPFLIAGMVLVLACYLLINGGQLISNIPYALLSVLKTAGLITAVLLLVQSLDANNPLIQKLCGEDNKDCNAILSSRSARVNDLLSWSEVGFFYFAGTWLTLLFCKSDPAVVRILAFLNIACLPYTFYSIHYQWRVAKQWCVFCCMVQALLWLEFFAFLPTFSQSFVPLSLAGWVGLFTGLLTPVMIWVALKPHFTRSMQVLPLKGQLRKFKYNPDLFFKLLNEENRFDLPADEYVLTVGDPKAEHVITMVANPYCQPCAKAHNGLAWLQGRSDVKLQLLFLGSPDKDEVVAHFYALAHDRAALLDAMHSWYGQKVKDYKVWTKDHPVAGDAAAIQPLLQAQKAWCDMAEVKATPTIFINGCRLPKQYLPEDLKYFL